MRFLDIAYRIGVGILVCGTLYRLFFHLIPWAFTTFGVGVGKYTLWLSVGLFAVFGPFISLKLPDWLLRSVSGEPEPIMDDAE